LCQTIFFTMANITLKRANEILKIDESRLERYLRYYAGEILYQQDELYPNKQFFTDTERKQFERYRRIFALFDIGRTDEQIRNIICEEFQVDWRQSYNIVNEAYHIYGITGKADKEGKKRFSINYYRRLSMIASDNGELETAGKLWEKADKLEGLFDSDEVGLNPDDFKHPTNFVFINSMNVFKQKQKELDADD
jgi:hypothetical protein